MGGTTCLVLGFSFASSTSCKCIELRARAYTHCFDTGQSPVSIGLLSGGVVGLIAGGFYETWRKQDCLLPPDLFTKATPGSIRTNVPFLAVLNGFPL